MDVAQEQVATARMALDLARERLRLGLGSIVELTQAEVAVTQAEAALTVSRNGVLTALAVLDYATDGGILRYTEKDRSEFSFGFGGEFWAGVLCNVYCVLWKNYSPTMAGHDFKWFMQYPD